MIKYDLNNLKMTDLNYVMDGKWYAFIYEKRFELQKGDPLCSISPH